MLVNVTDIQVYYAAWCIWGCIATISVALTVIFIAKYEWTSYAERGLPPEKEASEDEERDLPEA